VLIGLWVLRRAYSFHLEFGRLVMGFGTDFNATDQHGQTGIEMETGGNVDRVAFSGPLSSNVDRVAFSGPLTGNTDRVAFSGPLTGNADRVAFSGPLSGPLNKRPGRRSARFNIPGDGATTSKSNGGDEGYVEITLDVMDDSIAVHSVKPAGPGDQEDPEIALLAKDLEKKTSFGSSIIRNASARIKHVSQELKRLTSFTKRSHPGRLDRSKTGAHHALLGLKFITKTKGGADWNLVDQKFDELAVEGYLPRAHFGQCIGKSREPGVLNPRYHNESK
jgi:hypothetical protein